jgi:hypothetical protein
VRSFALGLDSLLRKAAAAPLRAQAPPASASL